VVPLGISRYNTEARMRPTTREEAAAVVDCVEDWQDVFLTVLGRRLVQASDEYYLLAGRTFPPAETYEGFAMHEDGVGMARTFELEFTGRSEQVTAPEAGFFAWADGADGADAVGGRYEAAGDYGAPAEGYRAVRTLEEPASAGGGVAVALRPRRNAPVGVLTSTAGAAVVGPLVASLGLARVRVIPVENTFFGGTTSVTGLLVGEDLAAALSAEPPGHRYLLPDVCLSDDGRFLDGTAVGDLPRPVEVVPTDGISLRRALETR
jgi:NifB/MoaA-like Fe-S oxidoreductase